MLDTPDGASIRADASALRALGRDHRESPAERTLAAQMEHFIAQEGQRGHDGTEGWKYRSAYELVIAQGRWFTPATLPASIRPLPERQCFANAMAVEAQHPHLAYTEGFALTADSALPILHAWCTGADGKVVDPTWPESKDVAYLGIILPSNLRPLPPRHWGVLEAPGSLYPLLRNGL
ncbi:hypothetical protein [Streptomyces sp. bgisy060]|uniref:hypothetical protein n=1 Tax=Streptomyces sp. bgisy060 TaxID=3413775 RepID=UPI003EBE30AD